MLIINPSFSFHWLIFDQSRSGVSIISSAAENQNDCRNLIKILQRLICDTNSFSYIMLVMGIFVYYLSKQGQFLLLRPGWQMSSWPPPCPLQSVSVQVLMLIRERSCGLPALALTPASSEPWSEVGPIHSLTDHKYFGLSTPRKVEKFLLHI